MRRALVTIVLGKKHQTLWKRVCEKNWKGYCFKHDLDLVVLDESLDTSTRGTSRSPSWQKCLILGQEKVKKYDQVAWLDSDIVINTRLAPNIFDGLHPQQIGGVEDWIYPTPELYLKMKLFQNNYAQELNLPSLNEVSVEQYYRNFGLPVTFNKVVQGGVLAFSPKHHRELLEKVYYNYEDKGASYWHYEMRPLSYEILKSNQIHWLDERFNRVWEIDKELFHPELFNLFKQNSLYFKVVRRLDFELGTSFLNTYAKTMHKYFNQSYFFHFAGAFSDMLLFKHQYNES